MKSLKTYYSNYLTRLEKEREDYVIQNSLVRTFSKCLEYIFGALIIMLLLLGNILDVESLKELYSSMGIVLYVLVFMWILLNWSKTLFIKSNHWDLGIRKDSMLVMFLIILNFIFMVCSLFLLSFSSNMMVDSNSEFLINLSNFLNLLFKVSIVGLTARCIIGISLYLRQKKKK